MAALFCASCSTDRATSATPEIVRLDSIPLRETDSLYLGKASGLDVDAAGRFYIADPVTSTVQVYAPDGSHVRGLGRAGKGPNEFKHGLGHVNVLDSSSIVVMDGRFATAIDSRSGEFLWTRYLPGFSFVVNAQAGRAYAARVSPSTKTTVLAFTGPHDSIFTGPFPWPLAESEMVATNFSAIEIAPRGDSLAVAAQSSPFLYVGSMRDYSQRDSTYVPAVGRRGPMMDLVCDVVDNPSQDVGMKLIYKQSIPWRLGWLPSDNIGYVLADLDLTQHGLVGKLHLTVVDPARHRVCPDALIPVPEDPLPPVAFRGDTLFAIVQKVLDDATATPDNPAMISYIARYLISTGNCQWVVR